MHQFDLVQVPRILRACHGVFAPGGQERWRGLDFWALHVYGYHAGLSVDGRRYELIPGSVSLVAPGADIRYRWRERSPHFCVHFLAQPGAVAIPEFLDQAPLRLGVELEALLDWLPGQPQRAAIRLLDRLWALAAAAGPRSLTDRLLAAIDRRITEAPGVAELAAALGVSRNTLGRQVRARWGCTVQALLRRRRAEHARALIVEAGYRSRDAAAAIGIHDAQAFNKLLRREFGTSPRALRALQA